MGDDFSLTSVIGRSGSLLAGVFLDRLPDPPGVVDAWRSGERPSVSSSVPWMLGLGDGTDLDWVSCYGWTFAWPSHLLPPTDLWVFHWWDLRTDFVTVSLTLSICSSWTELTVDVTWSRLTELGCVGTTKTAREVLSAAQVQRSPSAASSDEAGRPLQAPGCSRHSQVRRPAFAFETRWEDGSAWLQVAGPSGQTSRIQRQRLASLQNE